MTRWAYGVEPEASALPPLHVRCAGCGARQCNGCLESTVDVFLTVMKRPSMRRLGVLPDEYGVWGAWQGRAWRPDRAPHRALRRHAADAAGCCGTWVDMCPCCLEQYLGGRDNEQVSVAFSLSHLSFSLYLPPLRRPATVTPPCN